MRRFPEDFDEFCYPIGPSILASVVLWVFYYKLIRMVLLKKEPEFCNRLVTLTHGSTTAFMGMNQCFTSEPLFGYEFQTPFQKWLLIYSLGYFIFDLGWCCFHQTETKLMVAHHIFSCFSLGRTIYKNFSGSQATCALGCMEISNPLLQARWFVRTAGYHQTALFTSVEFTFMLVFIIVRIFFGTMFITTLVLHPENSLEFKIQGFIIYIISWMFLLNMLKYVSNKYINQDVLYVPAENIITEGPS